MTKIITKKIANAIILKCNKDDKTGRMKIDIGNCRLDFSKTYFFNGFTNKTVKLSWVNGNKEIHIHGKIEDRGKYFALYTEGWNFIEHIEKTELGLPTRGN